MKKIKLTRTAWRRKPQTQVIPNKRAEDKKYACRKGKRARQEESQGE